VITVVGTGVEAVDINLNGFTITGNPGEHVIRGFHLRSLVLRTGSVVAPPPVPFAAIEVLGSGVNRLTVEGLIIVGGSLWINEVEDVALRRNMITDSDWGLGVFGTPAAPATGVIEDNLIRNGTALGIDLGNIRSMLIRENQVESMAGSAITLNNTGGVHLIGNTVGGSGSGLGINIQASTSCLLAQNVVSDLGSTGIDVGGGTAGCLILNNMVSNNAGHGLAIGDSTKIKVQGNVVSGNGAHGVALFDADHCEIRDNTLSGNTGFGLIFDSTSDGNTYGDNTIRDNAGSGCANPGPATCGGSDLCDDGTGNTSFGDNLAPGPPPC
jgi:parallel beta-helix repeat protein